jgi:hypothetical protein
MDRFRPTPFQCPRCGTLYKVVGAEVPEPIDREIACLSCGGSLVGREGAFLLKYFLMDAPKERQRRSA